MFHIAVSTSLPPVPVYSLNSVPLHSPCATRNMIPFYPVQFPAPSKLYNVSFEDPSSLDFFKDRFLGQALDLLVPVSFVHYCTSTSGLSTM